MNKQITVPPNLAARPKDARGYPIFYTVAVRRDEEVDFSAIDSRKVAQCGFQQLCGLCGKSLVQNLTGVPTWQPTYFIGGAVSVMKTFFFQDPAMHKECAGYALQICPWIVLSQYRRRVAKDDVKFHRAGVVEIGERPPYLGLIHSFGFQYFFDENLFKAVKPSLVKLWKPGSDEIVSPLEVANYAAETLQKIQKERESRIENYT